MDDIGNVTSHLKLALHCSTGAYGGCLYIIPVHTKLLHYNLLAAFREVPRCHVYGLKQKKNTVIKQTLGSRQNRTLMVKT